MLCCSYAMCGICFNKHAYFAHDKPYIFALPSCNDKCNLVGY